MKNAVMVTYRNARIVFTADEILVFVNNELEWSLDGFEDIKMHKFIEGYVPYYTPDLAAHNEYLWDLLADADEVYFNELIKKLKTLK